MDPQLLLAILILCAVALGFFVVSKLYRFPSMSRGFRSGFRSSEDKNCFLLFGSETETAFVASLIKKYGAKFVAFENKDDIPYDGHFSGLIALSANDSDNMTACRVGRRVMEIPNIISKCSENQNISIFEENDIPYFITEDGLESVIAKWAYNVKGKKNDKVQPS